MRKLPAMIVMIAALAMPAATLAQTSGGSTTQGPTDATGKTAPAGSKVAPVPPPDASTAGAATPGTPVPPATAATPQTDGSKASPVVPPDASTAGSTDMGKPSTAGKPNTSGATKQ